MTYSPGNQYAKCFQCTTCGCTYPETYLKQARRIDDVLKLNETVFMCKDEKQCARMKVERARHLEDDRLRLERAMSKPIAKAKGGRRKGRAA